MSETSGVAWNYNIEAEESVVGGLLLDNSALDRIAEVVRPDDFFIDRNRQIFRVIAEMVGRCEPADIVTVSDALGADAKWALSYCGALAQATPSAHNILRYAEIVRERATVRRLASAAAAVVETCREGDGDAAALLDSAQASILALAEQRAKPAGQEMREVLSAAMAEIDRRFTAREIARAVGETYSEVTGVPTGFAELDEITTGMQAGELWIVGARPSMGKSALALQVLASAVGATNRAGLFMSLEMPSRTLGMRMLSAAAGVHLQRLATGRLSDDEWTRLTVGVGKIHELPIRFDERSTLTMMELRAAARRCKREMGGLSVVVVDYLQLMSSDVRHYSNRAEVIGEISRGLKNLARELDVPVIALSQLNRELERRPNKRPIMSDLRESGSVEQDADVILFIYRDEVYNPETPDKGKAEIIIGKQRNGPTGTIDLAFRGDQTSFSDWQGIP